MSRIGHLNQHFLRGNYKGYTKYFKKLHEGVRKPTSWWIIFEWRFRSGRQKFRELIPLVCLLPLEAFADIKEDALNILSLILWFLPFSEFIQYTFSYLDHSFLYIAGWYSTVGMYHHLFTHLFLKGHLGWFQFLLIMNEVAINTHMQVFMRRCIFKSVR